MINGFIAYQFDNADNLKLFETQQDINCWLHKFYYSPDEIVIIEYEVKNKEDLKELVERTKEFS